MSYYFQKNYLDAANEIRLLRNFGKGIIFLFVILSIQLLPHSKNHGDEAGGSADEVGNRFGEKDTICSKSAYGREPQRQRNDDDCFPQQGEEYSLFCFSQCGKSRLSGELQRHHKDSKEI